MLNFGGGNQLMICRMQLLSRHDGRSGCQRSVDELLCVDSGVSNELASSRALLAGRESLVDSCSAKADWYLGVS